MQDPGRLSGLDHRDVKAVEDSRVASHCLREEHPALDLAPHVPDHHRERAVVRLLLEDHERLYDREPGVDHGRELAGEDLQRPRLDLLASARRRCLRPELVERHRA